MPEIGQDLRFSLRSLARTRGLSLAALACIALGIGSTIFIYALTDALLIRSAPFPDAGRLLRIWKVNPSTLARTDLSYPDYRDLRDLGPLSGRKRDHDVYVPLEQSAGTVLLMAITTPRDPASLIQPMQAALGKLAPTSPVHWVSTMDEELAAQYADARLYAWLTGVFAASGLLLAALGIYGVLSNVVSRRFTELAIRMALGAAATDVTRLVLREGMAILLAGLAAGAALAAVLTRLFRDVLYEVGPADPAAFVAEAACITLAGALATWFPARRAAKAEAATLLRN